MNNLQTTPGGAQLTPIKAFSNFFQSDSIKSKFSDVLGQNASGFVSSVVSVVNTSPDLLQATHESIYGAALVAASMQLPINPSLGLAYIVPYNQRTPQGNYIKVAQFQISYKGLHQLALRSEKYRVIHATDVRQGELIKNDRMTGQITFDWIQDDAERKHLPIIGYVSYFELLNGFTSTFYMSLDEVQGHAKRYSKIFAKSGKGLWNDQFDLMALKTVSKLHLNRKGILSIEMERAIKFDGSSVKNTNIDAKPSDEIMDIEADYVDNEEAQEYDYDKALEEQLSQEQGHDAKELDPKVLAALKQAEEVNNRVKNNQKL